MKRLFTLLFLCMSMISMIASETTQLVVQSKDGTKVSYLLRTLPKLSFTDEITVSSNEVSITYSVPQLEKFYYEKIEVADGIKDLQTDELVFRYEGNAIIFSGLSAGSNISLYSINGILLFNKSNISEGEYMFSLDNLSTGAYLINVNETTCKIVKQ